MTDDGFNIGVLYKGAREPYRQAVVREPRVERDIDEEFMV
jgi:hypothetical protein